MSRKGHTSRAEPAGQEGLLPLPPILSIGAPTSPPHPKDILHSEEEEEGEERKKRKREEKRKKKMSLPLF